MPLFDLKCLKCSAGCYDKLLKTGDEVFCPDCGELMMKIVSRSNFELKGEGWFKDGYK